MLVIAHQRLADLKVFQEFLRLARIFTGNHRGFFPKHAEGAQGNVFQIADWCSNYVKRAVQRL